MLTITANISDSTPKTNNKPPQETQATTNYLSAVAS